MAKEPVSGGRRISTRLATIGDVPAMAALIPASARELSRGYYTEEQTEAAIRYIFGPDTLLINDRTYFAAEDGETLAGCGGWSRRRTLFGGDQTKERDNLLLDPAKDAARIRAFFVHPSFARRGVGSAILQACFEAAWAAGFRRVELAATLPGVPFYRVFGFEEREKIELPMRGTLTLPAIRMERALESPS